MPEKTKNNAKKNANPVGRPPRYKSVEELQKKIDDYFASCEGRVATNADGQAITDKYGRPVMIGQQPPTVTGLALALGFLTRQALIYYEGKKQFVDTIVRAKTRCEAYTEARLYDKDGCNGAKFSLTNNFRGWSDKPPEEEKEEGVTIIDDIPE